MKTRRIIFGLLIAALTACNFLTRMIAPPTVTPAPIATFTPAPTIAPLSTSSPLVPAYVPPECANKPFATVSPDIAAAQPTLGVQSNPPLSQTEQSRIFRRLTEIVEKVYVYPDYNGRDWNAIQEKYRSKIEAGLETEAFYQEMREMIIELGDEHSVYLSPLEVEEEEAQLKGADEYVGVGIYAITDYENQRIVIISTIPGASAEYGGIRAHDSILLVDNLPIEEATGNRIRGPECSVVIVKAQSPGESPREVMLVRHRIAGGPAIDARLVSTTDGSKVGYIFLPSFLDETLPRQMEDALNGFGELDGLIMDLRMNGGGSSTVAHPILGFFTGGKVGDFVSRADSRPLEIEANPIQNSQAVPLIMLVNEGTASYGEIFAGVMQDSGRAKVAGETTLGNVEVLLGYDFDDGSLMWLASETFKSAFSDENWEQTGIVPDAQAYAPWDSFFFETDPAIAAALELLGHQ